MYLHTRLSRGLSLTTRIGPLMGIFLLTPLIMANLAMLVFRVIGLVVSIVGLLALLGVQGWRMYRASHPAPGQRRALLQPLLDEAVTVSSQEILKHSLKAYAVYSVGHRFFSGPFPSTGIRLATLYPDQVADILIFGLFATEPTARKVSTSLKRLGFSTAELKRLFPAVRTNGVSTTASTTTSST